MYQLPKIFFPNSNTKLVRLGRSNDGGYSIPEKSLEEVKILYSFGLDDDWSFEEHFKKKTGAKVICFDNSVNYKFWIKRLLKDLIYFDFKKNYYDQFKRIFTFIKYRHFFGQKNVDHIKKHIISSDLMISDQVQRNFISFNNILKDWNGNHFFIKMDIEGNEYRILDDIIQNQKKLLGLVIEFHECDVMFNKIKSFIEKINLDLVHIHVNNFGSITKDNFPTVLELTFSAKKYNFVRDDKISNFPNKEIDQPNNREETDKKILFY